MSYFVVDEELSPNELSKKFGHILSYFFMAGEDTFKVKFEPPKGFQFTLYKYEQHGDNSSDLVTDFISNTNTHVSMVWQVMQQAIRKLVLCYPDSMLACLL